MERRGSPHTLPCFFKREEFMYDYKNYLRKVDIKEARLPLLKNLIKYTIRANEVSKYDYKDYHLIVDQDKGEVKITLTPDSISERAYVIVKADIEDEWQLHENMDWIDLVYYVFSNIKIIEARYHRYNDSLSNDEAVANECLGEGELEDPELNMMIKEALTDGYYFEETDKVTGRSHTNYELGLSFKDEPLEEPPKEQQ